MHSDRTDNGDPCQKMTIFGYYRALFCGQIIAQAYPGGACIYNCVWPICPGLWCRRSAAGMLEVGIGPIFYFL